MKTNDDLHEGHGHIYRRLNKRMNVLEQMVKDLTIALDDGISEIKNRLDEIIDNQEP